MKITDYVEQINLNIWNKLTTFYISIERKLASVFFISETLFSKINVGKEKMIMTLDEKKGSMTLVDHDTMRGMLCAQVTFRGSI